MKANDVLFPFIVIPVGLVFLAICALVYLSRGKSKRLIASKLKVGAFLLTFSWFAGFTGCITCYATVTPENTIVLYNDNDSIKTGDPFRFSIENTRYKYYSYTLLDSITSNQKQSGKIVKEGNNFYKSFIALDSNLPAGSYFLDIYGEENDQINKYMFIKRVTIYK